ncbi:tryptorubin family RiPP precursor [Streptomyces angustmyceticus]|uniref:tryptorubin family RiPP precursor n=1 Tax=Streptomyces angustmyceticus TaxID=285578 RepID=UPI003804AD9D
MRRGLRLLTCRHASPQERGPHESLVTAVLAWKDPDLEARDCEQIAFQVTGHACAVAAEVRRHTATLPKSDGHGALAEVILRLDGPNLPAGRLPAEWPASRIWNGPPDKSVHHSLIALVQPFRAGSARPPHEEVRDISTQKGGAVMKILFAIRNKVSAQKSLKASAWYFWY